MGAEGGYMLWKEDTLSPHLPKIWRAFQKVARKGIADDEMDESRYGWMSEIKPADARLQHIVRAIGFPEAMVIEPSEIFSTRLLRVSYGTNICNEFQDVWEGYVPDFSDETWT